MVPPSNIPGQTFGDLAPSAYPGERLGLPREGHGSVARFGRRLIALVIDWAIASLVVSGIAALVPAWNAVSQHPATIPLVFAVLQIVFISTIGGSMGHRLLGLRIVPLAGGYVGLWRPVVRTVLLCLVVPILVWDSDQRGFHDKIAGTVLIRG
nr:RDD family protein [Microbacterium agarici]